MFPSHKLSTDPRSRVIRHHHVYENYLIRAVKHAAHSAGITKHVSVETTMIYTHVMNKGGRGVTSPLDRLISS